MAKEKMSSEKKAKLIYSGELMFFAIVFAVIATLEITRILKMRDWVLIAFNWLTIFGGAWMIADFIWVLLSKKRRAKNSLLDKALLIPLGIYLITFDILCFTGVINTYDLRLYMMVGAFYYVAVVYLFESIYHYFVPVPALLEDDDKEEKKEAEVIVEDNEALKSETKEEEKE